ncbi:thiol reductant ABC exporter subunit CydC [Vreelandella rituensis]|uniref:Thiol reductant ABC exporter subunit CydC n=1 Tax=Vreelandella rituensis TaxID=2282306 RepID=A0A368U7Y9_9GAMM|nr:thiol reductant ABC exporter subunit CydC [Halomonas rituensis]RCV93299.1 thiol reductant ABC exporter subunit CydC [Halomonas rituensis]
MAKLNSLAVTFRPWLAVLAKRRKRLGLGAMLMALTLFSALGLLAVSGWFITATGLTGLLLAAGVAASLEVYVPGGAIRFFAVSRTVSRYVERLYNHDTVLRLLADLRTQLFGVLAGLDSRALAQRRASDWLNRLTADIDTLDSLYLRLLAPPAVALLAILLLSGGVALFVPLAGGSLAALLLLGWLWLTLGQARLGLAASERHVSQLEALRSRTMEQLQGMAELKAYGSLAIHRERLTAIEQHLQHAQQRLGHWVALGNALEGWLVGAATLMTLWLAALAWQAGSISGAVMVMLPMAVLAMNEALGALPAAFTWFGATKSAAERLNQLEAQRQPVPETTTSDPGSAHEISLNAVSVHYPTALQPALDNLSLTLKPGERWAIVGESGSGKSTLAMLISRQLTPTQGNIILGGIPLEYWPDAALRRRVAVLTQQTELLDASLATNLRLANPDAGEDDLWQALERVALASWVQTLPQGLDTWVGEGGRRLSGGQARRVALARLYLCQPDLVILDEPFAGVDEPTAQLLSDSLDAWLKERSVIYLVHDVSNDAPTPPGITHMLRLIEGRPNAAATIRHGANTNKR